MPVKACLFFCLPNGFGTFFFSFGRGLIHAYALFGRQAKKPKKKAFRRTTFPHNHISNKEITISVLFAKARQIYDTPLTLRVNGKNLTLFKYGIAQNQQVI